MPLPNTPLNNPLTVSERDTLRGTLERLAEEYDTDLAAGPAAADLQEEGLSEPQWRDRTRRAAERLRATAQLMAADTVGFDETAVARNILTSGPDTDRELNTIAAKLQQALDQVMPQRVEQVRALRAQQIAEQKFTVQHVMGRDEPLPLPPVSQTVGLLAHGHPELAVVGLDARAAERILLAAGRRVLNGQRIAAGDLLTGLLGHAFTAVSCPPSLESYLHYDGRRPHAVQLLWSDEHGRFPGSDKCETAVADAQRFPDRPR